MKQDLDRLSSAVKLKCQKCGTLPLYYKPGKQWEYQDYNSAESEIEAYCPICNAQNILSFHGYEGGWYHQWNTERIK